MTTAAHTRRSPPRWSPNQANGPMLFPLVFGVALCLAPSAQAIVVLHDLADANYVVEDADHPALVDLISPGDCIGTLVHESYLLTVAHCAVDLTVGQTLQVNGAGHAVAEVTQHPSWQDLDAFDIALVRLATPVTTVAPLPIYRETNELGAVITLVGRGVTATGEQGEEGGESDGKLRRATNVVTAANGHFLEIIFERSDENGVTEFEGVGAAGDSGCPAFIDVEGVPHIAGLNSYGDGNGNADVGQYGARDYQTRISQYLPWLDEQVDFPTDAPPTDAGLPDAGENADDADNGDDDAGPPTTGGDPPRKDDGGPNDDGVEDQPEAPPDPGEAAGSSDDVDTRPRQGAAEDHGEAGVGASQGLGCTASGPVNPGADRPGFWAALGLAAALRRRRRRLATTT